MGLRARARNENRIYPAAGSDIFVNLPQPPVARYFRSRARTTLTPDSW